MGGKMLMVFIKTTKPGSELVFSILSICRMEIVERVLYLKRYKPAQKKIGVLCECISELREGRRKLQLKKWYWQREGEERGGREGERERMIAGLFSTVILIIV
jgi:hypothetical protein